MHTRLNSRESQRYLHSQAQAFNAFFERTVYGDIVYIFDLAVVFSLAPALAPPAYAPLRQQPATPAEIAWAYAEQSRKARPRLTARSAHRQNTAPNTVPIDSEALPTVRGRAANMHKGIVTIDVAAVNE